MSNFCVVLRNVVAQEELAKKLRKTLTGDTKVVFAKITDAEGITRAIMAARKKEEEENKALSGFIIENCEGHTKGIDNKPFGDDDPSLDDFYIQAVTNIQPDAAMKKFVALKKSLQATPA